MVFQVQKYLPDNSRTASKRKNQEKIHIRFWWRIKDKLELTITNNSLKNFIFSLITLQFFLVRSFPTLYNFKWRILCKRKLEKKNNWRKPLYQELLMISRRNLTSNTAADWLYHCANTLLSKLDSIWDLIWPRSYRNIEIKSKHTIRNEISYRRCRVKVQRCVRNSGQHI